MLLLRKIHLYLGMLFAPTIIFFAFTGAMQTLGLHEAEKADDRAPAAWIVALAELHKEQHLPRPKPHTLPDAPADRQPEQGMGHGDDAPGVASSQPGSPTLLKAFVLLMAIGVVVSSVLGILIAFKHVRFRSAAVMVLIAGMLLPLGLIIL